MFRCQLSNEFGPGHLSGEEVPHRAVVITEKQRAFEPTLSCAAANITLCTPGSRRVFLCQWGHQPEGLEPPNIFTSDRAHVQDAIANFAWI